MAEGKFPAQTADQFITQRMTDLRHCLEHRGNPDMKDPAYVRALHGSVDGFQIVVLMEAVRLLNPTVADLLAREIDSALEDGGVIGELAWEWDESTERGLPISEPVPSRLVPNYRSIWQRVLDEANLAPVRIAAKAER